ncbi:MAG: tetratricopeptide repeat protein [Bdellovibrionales bacterium]|jgi:tetratricopeptide (TPR) repeat protein|nr:tetratricopeptide repeat protein [Bdellovibrionales bacterium]
MKTIFCSYKTLTVACAFAFAGMPFFATLPQADTTQAHSIEISDSHFAQAPARITDMPTGNTFSGNYLAARFAQRQQDWPAAQHYMNAVVNFDSENELMTSRAFLLSLGAGEYPAARRLAEKITAEHQNGTDIASIFMACEAMTRGEFQTAADMVARLPDDGFGQYTKPLLTAWAKVGMGDRTGAIAHLSEYSEETDPTYNLHLAMMYDIAGDTENAAKHYTASMEDNLSLHNVLLLADFFTRSGNTEMASRLRDGIGDLYNVPAAKNNPPMIRTPADGAAVAMFDLATMLFERRSFDSAQIYSHLVMILSPQSDFGRLMVGDIATINEHYGPAAAAYGKIPATSPLYLLSRLRIAETYEAANKTEAAATLLRELSAMPQTRMQALTALGDMHRRNENFTQAIAIYDEILADVTEPGEDHWALIYARGMSLERANEWDRAEKDLLLALSFQPDNPMILNYIGYTWIDKGVNLQKGMDFVRRAVNLRPDDGYILDSYGWAFYRLGDMQQAVYWLEKSVALVPDDTAILDHLADAYWQSGRHTEARFKWQRARTLSKDADFRAAVERKLRNGMEPAATTLVHKDTSL